MTVFKNYFKIILRYKWIILLYTGICLGISILNTTSGGTTTEQFIASTPDIAIINNDESTELIKGFEEYINQNAEIIEIENTEQAIQDALFYRKVNYVLIIPKGYTQDVLSNRNPKIEIRKTKDSYAVYTEMLVNRYAKMLDFYSNTGMSQIEINEAITKDIKNEANIVIVNANQDNDISKPLLYYNFANYSFLAISIYLIATIMNVFNNKMIKKRNNIGKMSYKKISNQLFLGNSILVLGVWIIYVGISFILYNQQMRTSYGLLLMLSSFVFIITAGSIGFLISSIVKNKNAISGIVNVVALGLSFISGCFVPQQWLNDTVLGVAKLFPSYWYINANEKIVNITEFTMEQMQPILTNLLIILGFGAIYLIMSKVNWKKIFGNKKKSNA